MPSNIDESSLPKLKRKYPPEEEIDEWGLTIEQQV